MNRAVARRGVGIAVAAVFLAGAAALVAAPWPGRTAEPVVIAATPPAVQTVLACTGPLLMLGADRSDAAALSPIAAQNVTVRSADADAEWRELAAPDVPASAPAVLVVPPHDGRRVEAAAAGSAQIDTSDIRGLAAAACARPATETWLVGGGVDVGSADLVLLSNPGAVAARADITVYGGDGAVEPATGTGIVVAPGTQRVSPLASLALGQTQPVLRVTASSAPLHVVLQSSITRTLIPGGVDVGAAVAAPEMSLTIPSVPVFAPPAADTATVSMRLLAPAAAATATVTLVPVGGEALEPIEMALEAGRPAVLSLPGLPAGTYTVRVEATDPVVAAVWHATGLGEGSDFAWSMPAQPLTGATLAAVALGPAPTLTLVADEEGDRTVTVTAAAGDGANVQVTVPAGRAVTVPVTPGEVYLIDPDGRGVRASISFAGAGALAGYPVAPSEQAAAEVDVTVR